MLLFFFLKEFLILLNAYSIGLRCGVYGALYTIFIFDKYYFFIFLPWCILALSRIIKQFSGSLFSASISIILPIKAKKLSYFTPPSTIIKETTCPIDIDINKENDEPLDLLSY